MPNFDIFTQFEVLMAAFEHPDVKDADMAGKDLTDEHIAFGFVKFFESEKAFTIDDPLILVAVQQYREDEREHEEMMRLARQFVNQLIPPHLFS